MSSAISPLPLPAAAAQTPYRFQHDPYQGSVFGASIKSPSSLGSSLDEDSTNTPPILSQRNTAPSTPYHRPSPSAHHPFVSSTAGLELMHEHALGGRCELLIPPQIAAIERPTPVGKPTLFLGHMRFETSAAELRWVIYTTTGVRALKCEPRAAGCFVVYLDCENDVALVRNLHKRLLFDLGGIWFARTPEQVDIMADYIRDVLAPKRARREKVRVPHDALCVEVQKTFLRRTPPQAAAGGAAPHMMMLPYPMAAGGSHYMMGAQVPPPYSGDAYFGYSSPQGMF